MQDTYREIYRRECASTASARFAGKFCPQGDTRDCTVSARPVDEAAETEQGLRSDFCKPATTGTAKTGHRNQQNFCRADARRNGFPLEPKVYFIKAQTASA